MTRSIWEIAQEGSGNDVTLYHSVDVNNMFREMEGVGLDPNTVDSLHFRLDWLQGLIARLLDLYGIDEQIVNLIRGHGIVLLEVRVQCYSQDKVFHHQLLPLRDNVDAQKIQFRLDFLVGRYFSVVDIATKCKASTVFGSRPSSISRIILSKSCRKYLNDCSSSSEGAITLSAILD